MVKLRKTPKHSTGDWDFSDVLWELDSTDYVSSPSSLSKLPDGTTETRVLIKTTTVPSTSVKEGRISTYIKLGNSVGAYRNICRIILRYQDENNYYYVVIGNDNATTLGWEIHRIYGGVDTLLANGTLTFTYWTWIRYRVTWWNDYVGLVIRFEYYIGGAWTTISTAYDSSNYWTGGGRVGFKMRRWVVADICKIDDTEIYGIPP